MITNLRSAKEGRSRVDQSRCDHWGKTKMKAMWRISKSLAGGDYFGNLGNFAHSREGRGDISGQTVTGLRGGVWSIRMWCPLLCHPLLVWAGVTYWVPLLALRCCFNQPFPFKHSHHPSHGMELCEPQLGLSFTIWVIVKSRTSCTYLYNPIIVSLEPCQTQYCIITMCRESSWRMASYRFWQVCAA